MEKRVTKVKIMMDKTLNSRCWLRDEDEDNRVDDDMQYEDEQEVAKLVQSDKKKQQQDTDVNDKLLIDLNELDDSEK